jgi:hypothetical protein
MKTYGGKYIYIHVFLTKEKCVLAHAGKDGKDTTEVTDTFQNALKNGQKFLTAYENNVDCSVPVNVYE